MATLADLDLRTAACRHLPPDWWFPAKGAGQSNHGRLAKAMCAACPLREGCLEAAVARAEAWGIWGAAGEARRRVLRRAYAEGSERWALVVAAHWRQVDKVPEPGDRELLAGYSGGAHGHRSTYSRGCPCEPCAMAASLDGVLVALTKPKRKGGGGSGRSGRQEAA